MTATAGETVWETAQADRDYWSDLHAEPDDDPDDD